MMARYKLNGIDPNSVFVNNTDLEPQYPAGTSIGKDSPGWEEYQEWLAVPNTPDPADYSLPE